MLSMRSQFQTGFNSFDCCVHRSWLRYNDSDILSTSLNLSFVLGPIDAFFSEIATNEDKDLNLKLRDAALDQSP